MNRVLATHVCKYAALEQQVIDALPHLWSHKPLKPVSVARLAEIFKALLHERWILAPEDLPSEALGNREFGQLARQVRKVLAV